MQHSSRTLTYLISSLAVLFLISSCGTSDESTPTAGLSTLGLSTPAAISLVPEVSSGTAAISSAFNSSNTDYVNQKADSWIKTTSGTELLEEANYMLCIMKLANIADYPNKTYRAQHNARLCRRPTSAWPLRGEGPINREMLITTSRTSISAPYKQTLWFQIPYGGQLFDNTDWDFVADMTVTEAPSATNPLGLFELHFRSVRSPDIGVSYVGTSDYNGVMKVYREGSKNYLTTTWQYRNLYDADPNHQYDTYKSMIVELDGSGSISGRALVDEPRGHWNNGYLVRDISKLAFNATHINEQKNSDTEICTSRTNMLSNVWDYKMFYKDSGKELDMNGGFSITYGTTGKRGWVDGYGLNTSIEGDTPSVVTSKKTGIIYDVVKAAGKLQKKTKGDRNLATNEELIYWKDDAEFTVTWSGSTFTSSDSDSTAALSELNAATDSSARWPWSRRLNQDVKYTGTNAIVYWDKEDVHPWSEELLNGDLSLTCYQFCPDGNVSQSLADAKSWDQSAIEAIDNTAFSTTGKSYAFNPATMLLKSSGTPVVLDPSVSGEVQFKMRLVPAGTVVANSWNVDELPVHYIWRSGTKKWQQSAHIKNQSTNAWYEFSDPIGFDYTHLTANDLNDSSTYNGINYYLKYDGGLHGIPTQKLENGTKIREISLNDGDIFNGKAMYLGKQLVLKAVGIEKNPIETSGACNDLALSEVALTLPNALTPISVSKTWDQQFDVIGVPSEYLVIDGVTQ